MSGAFAVRKRFWTAASAVPVHSGPGFSVQLDARALTTPLKSPLIVPTQTLAEAIAQEWDAQDDEIVPQAMPLTRAANAAIDKVVPNRDAVAQMLADYGGTDLLCYRAAEPDALVKRQIARWDPWIDWAETQFGATLRTGAGVMHVPQSAVATAQLSGPVRRLGPWHLTALHDLVTLSGSLVLALAVQTRALDPVEAWALSRLDEDWQQEQWGIDAEAQSAAEEKQAAFCCAARLLDLLEG